MNTEREAIPTPISRYTTLRARPGMRDELVLALQPLLQSASAEPGLTEYSLHASDDDPDELWFFARFADAAALSEHERRESAASTHMVLSVLLPLLSAPANTFSAQVLWTLPPRMAQEAAPAGVDRSVHLP